MLITWSLLYPRSLGVPQYLLFFLHLIIPSFQMSSWLSKIERKFHNFPESEVSRTHGWFRETSLLNKQINKRTKNKPTGNTSAFPCPSLPVTWNRGIWDGYSSILDRDNKGRTAMPGQKVTVNPGSRDGRTSTQLWNASIQTFLKAKK